jgi:hypothetical protein
VFFDCSRGKGCAFLFIYLFIQLSKMTMSFWILASLTASHSPNTCPALAKTLLACAKGFRVWFYFLESSVM